MFLEFKYYCNNPVGRVEEDSLYECATKLICMDSVREIVQARDYYSRPVIRLYYAGPVTHPDGEANYVNVAHSLREVKNKLRKAGLLQCPAKS